MIVALSLSLSAEPITGRVPAVIDTRYRHHQPACFAGQADYAIRFPASGLPCSPRPAERGKLAACPALAGSARPFGPVRSHRNASLSAKAGYTTHYNNRGEMPINAGCRHWNGLLGWANRTCRVDVAQLRYEDGHNVFP